MDFFKIFTEISSTQFILYNLVIVVVFIYLFYKHRQSSISQYLLFLFTVGTWGDLGSLVFSGNMMLHVHKVIIVVWGLVLLLRYRFQDKDQRALLLILPFFIYFIFVSIWGHDDGIGLVLSQVLKYLLPILTLFIMDGYIARYQMRGLFTLNRVFNHIILAQIFFCFAKLVLIQATLEGWVGSMTGIRGGGAGTSFPLLCLIWLAINTRMEISRKNVLYAIGFLFIGFMTGKRAIWLLFPILYMILFVVYRMRSAKQSAKYLFPTLILGFIFFYFGLRLSPTLNPEQKVWGSFDPTYAYEYIFRYSTGHNMVYKGDVKVEEGGGRLGAAMLFWNDLIDISSYNKVALLGEGNEYISHADYSDYNNANYYRGITSRGSVTGIVFMYFSIGIIGVFLFFIYFVPILCRIKNIRLRWVVIGTVLFDFIFYNGQIVENFVMQSMLFFIVVMLSFYFKISRI